ncbi:hypothetical protein F3Y22_tig00111840pilonHSYRG00012 [Hibiscus syriacus]|uniref:Uncharacterized protein n=1 Tax=Hibiscus syriacus TaxID=106335 RepID=A0A6A2YEB7_HIBSY|nr:hypothetical protein F3Y22_tig00111840pilonHSYRG00012 [Hibiscus syriacus]
MRESKFKGFHMYSSFSIPIFGVLLISILSKNIESKETARSSSKVVERCVDSISCAGRDGDGNIDFSYCNKDLDCNSSSHSSVSVCSLGSGKVPSSQKLNFKSVVGGRSEISPKIYPKLEEDTEGSSENPLDKNGDWLCEECKLVEETENKKQGLDAEGKMENKLISSTPILSKRHIGNLEGASAPKRQVVNGSPRSLSPNGVSSLSRESSFKNLDKGKVRPSPQISLGNHSGSLLKCSSFNTLNSNSKVKLVMRSISEYRIGSYNSGPERGLEVSTTSVPPASNSRLSPLPLEPTGFSCDHGETIDIPLDTASGGSHNQDLNKKVQAKEAELKSLLLVGSEAERRGSDKSRYYNMDQRRRSTKSLCIPVSPTVIETLYASKPYRQLLLKMVAKFRCTNDF